MKRALLGLLLGCLVTMGFSTVASAAFDNQLAAISVHITPMVTKLPCDNQPHPTAASMVTDVCGAPETGYSVWILVCNGSDSLGVAGMEFGIDYDALVGSGIDWDSWNLCADLDFPSDDWPDAGSGTIVAWDRINNCQNINSEPFVPHTVVAIAGVLNVWAYGPDQLFITPRPVSGFAKIANCNAAEDRIDGKTPSHLGIGGFCLPGYNPCGFPTAVEPTTWGKVKQLY